VLSFAQNDTLRICSYNLLNFDSVSGEDRVEYFRTVIDSIDPDILACQEIGSDAAADYFIENILDPEIWDRSSFTGVGYSDVVLFFKPSQLIIQEHHSVVTELRNVEIFDLTIFGSNDFERLIIASTHLKASSGSINENRRRMEVTSFLNYLDNNAGLPTSQMMFCGDFNFYEASESGYQLLMNDGRFVDPIDREGEWHNNSWFADIHTQSPRTTSFGSGATGGMDDRFDFILAAPEFFDGQEWEYIEGSYKAYGNDGDHFNQAINSGTNGVVAQNVADAIHNASDHLPVIMDVVKINSSSVEDENVEVPNNYLINEVYPNPFNSTVNVVLNLRNMIDVKVEIFNIQGRKVARVHNGPLNAGIQKLSYSADRIPSGIYILQVEAVDGHKEFRKLAFMK